MFRFLVWIQTLLNSKFSWEWRVFYHLLMAILWMHREDLSYANSISCEIIRSMERYCLSRRENSAQQWVLKFLLLFFNAEPSSSEAEEERSSLAIKNRCPVIRIFIANLRSWRRDSHGNEAFSHAFKLSTYYPDHYYEKHICKPYFSDGKIQAFIYSPHFMVQHFSMIPSTVTF